MTGIKLKLKIHLKYLLASSFYNTNFLIYMMIRCDNKDLTFRSHVYLSKILRIEEREQKGLLI